MLLDRLEKLGRLASFALEILIILPGVMIRPGLWIRPFYRVLVGGIPLGVVAGLALGIVVWVHTRSVLDRTGTGAVEFLPTFLAAAVLMELAPIGAGLIVAARTGASLGAELSSLRVSEQIDAMELLGINPLRRLVGPRVLACCLAVPMLHILIAVLAIGSGYCAEMVLGQTSWLKYQSAVLRELYLFDVVPAFLKTILFGFLVGVTSCQIGLSARGGSEEVGTAATDSVVACSLLVLLADVFCVGLIRWLVG